jgi:CDP-diacylglycerol--glycerol-3-phosphate 3-phosphatidyltransferase
MSLKWLPNAITIARCLLAVVVGYLILEFDAQVRADTADTVLLSLPFVLFTIVAATDWLDGKLARGLNAESAFGARLDPIADKLLSASSLLALSVIENWALFIAIPTIAIVARDVLITAMREAMGNPGTMKVSSSAKWKTALVLSGIGAVLLGMAVSELAGDADQFSPAWIASRGILFAGLAMVWIAAIMAVMTAWDYISGLRGSSGTDDDLHQ